MWLFRCSPAFASSAGPFPSYPAMRLLLLCLLLAFSSASSAAETLSGRVARVESGDAVYLIDAAGHHHVVRLAGIDAPERGQPFGDQSRQRLAALVGGRDVTVLWYKRDSGGRLIGKVWIDGLDVSFEMVRSGMAWHYKRFAPEQPAEDRPHYAAIEAEARMGRVGLWADPSPVPPWEWPRP